MWQNTVVFTQKMAQIPLNDVLQYVQWMIGHGHPRDFPIITFPPFYLCAAGIGRTFWHRKVIPAQTACRETYGLLLYAVRSLHPTIRGGRSHLPHGTNRTLRTSQRCGPGGTFRGECSKAGEAVSKTAWVGSIPNRPCHMYATALRHHGRVRPLQGACLCAV